VRPLFIIFVMNKFNRHLSIHSRKPDNQLRTCRPSCRDLFLRITDFSYLRPFVPENERSLWKTSVRGNFRSCPGTFLPVPFVPRNFCSWDFSFPGSLVLIFACTVLYQQFGPSNSVGRRVKLLEDVGFMFRYLNIIVVCLTEEQKTNLLFQS